MVELSPRQREALLADDGERTCYVGSVRSGKSWAAVTKFLNQSIIREPGNYVHPVCGRSPSVLEQEVRLTMQDHFNTLGIPWRWNGSKRVMEAAGHRFPFFAWSSKNSVERVMGATAGNVLVDEAGLVERDFWRGLMSRLTFPWSRVWATANPGDPSHWLKAEIDAGRVNEWKFTFTDNPILDAKTIRRFHGLYPRDSVHYRRLVLGEWSAAEGLVFPSWQTHVPGFEQGAVYRTIAGFDWGMASPSALVRVELRRNPTRQTVTHSFEIGGGNLRLMAHALAARVREIHREHPFEILYVDPATPIKPDLNAIDGRKFVIRNADNDRSRGIQTVSRLMASSLSIADTADTEPLRRELLSYAYDTTRPDEPVKADDHQVDCVRYALHTALGTKRSILL